MLSYFFINLVYLLAWILQFKVSGGKNVAKELLHALQLVQRIWRRVISLSERKIIQLISEPRNLILDAVERGNIEFLCILIREYPDIILLHLSKENDYNIFHIAVMNRQEHVFKLIDELFYVYINQIDEEGNNILHLAGMLAPSHRLNIAAGAALQMRRELLWFKVRCLITPVFLCIKILFYLQ